MNWKAESPKEKHEFALFVENLSSLVAQKKEKNEFILVDEALVHRIATILRLQVGDVCTFFDQKIHVQCLIVAFVGKKQIQTTIQLKQPNKVLVPEITFLLPLLKRDDYEKALYSLAETGVTTIQLVTTKKTSTSWAGNKDKERAERILISAAEQSKHFSIPVLKSPVALSLAIQTNIQKKIFFDAQGVDFFTSMTNLYNEKPQQIMILVGPEGDLSSEEKNMVKEQGFVFCALTPTILRSVQAVALSAGFVRSLFTR